MTTSVRRITETRNIIRVMNARSISFNPKGGKNTASIARPKTGCVKEAGRDLT